jgi:hypothetical protein
VALDPLSTPAPPRPTANSRSGVGLPWVTPPPGRSAMPSLGGLRPSSPPPPPRRFDGRNFPGDGLGRFVPAAASRRRPVACAWPWMSSAVGAPLPDASTAVTSSATPLPSVGTTPTLLVCGCCLPLPRRAVRRPPCPCPHVALWCWSSWHLLRHLHPSSGRRPPPSSLTLLVAGFLSSAPAGLPCFMLCSTWLPCNLCTGPLAVQGSKIGRKELVLGLGESLALLRSV